MSQQLVKKGANGKHENVMPKSWTEAIKDKYTGQSLLEILQGFNMYFLSYNGNIEETRNMVPTSLRKKGLWITYVKYDGNVYTEWYASSKIDDKSWGDSSNWRIGNNTLVGDITISANGNWVINGTETDFKAVGEKGNTPLIRVANNRLQVSYDLGETYLDVTDNPVYTKFRWYAESENIGRIQASTDEGKTWTNMSNDFTNNLHIKKYIGVNESLPTSGIAEGTIYAKGPYYAEDDTLNDNPIYRLWVYAWKGNTLAWQDNGEFTSIAAGIVQETGDSEAVVMSQKAVTDKLSELGSEVSKQVNGNLVIEEWADGSYVSIETGSSVGGPTYYSRTGFINIPNYVKRIKVTTSSVEGQQITGVCFYREDKTLIVGYLTPNRDLTTYRYDVPSETVYVRFTCLIEDKEKASVCVENIIPTFDEFKEKIEELGKVVEDVKTNSSFSAEGKAVIKEFPLDGYIAITGVANDNGDGVWKRLDFTPIPIGLKTVDIKLYQQSSGISMISFYDNAYTKLLNVTSIEGGTDKTIVEGTIDVPNYACYIRATYREGKGEQYIVFDNKPNYNYLKVTSLAKPFTLEGANCLAVGDSIMKGYNSSGDTISERPWINIVSDACKFANLRNVAVGGAGFLRGVTILQQLQSVQLDSRDIIVISAGGNDHDNNIPISTYEQAIEEAFSYLDANKGITTKVLFVTPINRARPTDVNNVLPLDCYRDMITKKCLEHRYSVIDGSMFGFTDYYCEYQELMQSDGLHPTDLGYQIYANHILGLLL